MIITEKDLKVKTTFGDVNKLDPSKVLIGLQGLDPGSENLNEGVHFVERKLLKINQIYYRLEDNPYRYDGKNEAHSNRLGKFIDIMGYDYSKSPPVIEHHSDGIRDKDTGKQYFYNCLSGAHTGEALLANGIEEWIYDQYSYDSDAARQKHIAKLNGSHAPDLVSSQMDAINHTTKLIKENQLDLEDLSKYIKVTYPSVPDHDRIVSSIERKFTYRDEAIFTSKDIKKFMEGLGFGVGGKIVNGRAQWACKEGYEDRRAIQALLKYAKTGVSSDFHVYVNGSTDKESISDKRWKVDDKFKEIEKAILKLFEEWKATGSKEFPWELLDFVAQRNQEGETGLLTHDEIEPKKKISDLFN